MKNEKIYKTDPESERERGLPWRKFRTEKRRGNSGTEIASTVGTGKGNTHTAAAAARTTAGMRRDTAAAATAVGIAGTVGIAAAVAWEGPVLMLKMR